MPSDERPRTFYYRAIGDTGGLADGHLVELIQAIQDELPGYGYRRVTHELRRRGHIVNHKRVARLVNAGIKPRRHFVRTTDSYHDSPIFPNRYSNAIPSRPDLVWVADFTYIRIATGFSYLAAILDARSRKVVGYAIPLRIDTPLALAALRRALESRRPTPECIHHTDRGCQHASDAYWRALREAGLRGSMSSPANPYDNAQAESYMKMLKVEEVHLVGYETFAMWQHGCQASSTRSTTPSGFTQHLATVHPTDLNCNSPRM